MKALLCAINSKYIHSTLAVWYMASGINKYAPGVKAKVLEATINEDNEKILEKILSYNFDIIGFSTYIWNKEMVLLLAEKLKEKKNVKIVLGGPEVSYNASELLEKYPFIDYILCGEGEKSFAQLCNGVPLNIIDNLCYRDVGKIMRNLEKNETDDPPPPYTEDYFKALNGRIAYIETSRGCPFRCGFCLSGRCGTIRFFDINEAKENIIKLANSGTKTVKFIDRTFNADKKRAIEIFNFIIDNYGKKVPPSVCFHFEIEGELLDDETINVLKKAPEGLFQFEIGIQSFNEKTLESINRKCNLERLCKRINQVVALENIHVHTDLIIGLPFENIESFENSFNKAYDLGAQMLQIGFLKILNGADLKDKSVDYKLRYQSKPPYEIISTPWLSDNDVKKLHLLEDVFEKAYNSGRFLRTCGYLVSLTKNPFKLFMKLGNAWSKCENKKTLDDFSKFLFDATVELFGADKKILRDKMVLDRMASNKNCTLPEFLKVHSPKIKQILNELEKNPKTKRPKNVKRSATLLASENKFVYVDYINQNKVKNQYTICEKIIEKDEN